MKKTLILILLLVLIGGCSKKHLPKSSAMIIKIDKFDKDVLEKTCATLLFEVKFFTIEISPTMIQAEITDGGREISPTSAYRIGQMVGMEKLHKAMF